MEHFSIKKVSLVVAVCFSLTSGQECVGMKKHYKYNPGKNAKKYRSKELASRQKQLRKNEERKFKKEKAIIDEWSKGNIQDKEIKKLINENPLVFAAFLNICSNILALLKKAANPLLVLPMVIKGVEGICFPHKNLGYHCGKAFSFTSKGQSLCKEYAYCQDRKTGFKWSKYSTTILCDECDSHFPPRSFIDLATSCFESAPNQTTCLVQVDNCSNTFWWPIFLSAATTAGLMVGGYITCKGIKYLVLRSRKAKEASTANKTVDEIVDEDAKNVMKNYIA